MRCVCVFQYIQTSDELNTFRPTTENSKKREIEKAMGKRNRSDAKIKRKTFKINSHFTPCVHHSRSNSLEKVWFPRLKEEEEVEVCCYDKNGTCPLRCAKKRKKEGEVKKVNRRLWLQRPKRLYLDFISNVIYVSVVHFFLVFPFCTIF